MHNCCYGVNLTLPKRRTIRHCYIHSTLWGHADLIFAFICQQLHHCIPSPHANCLACKKWKIPTFTRNLWSGTFSEASKHCWPAAFLSPLLCSNNVTKASCQCWAWLSCLVPFHTSFSIPIAIFSELMIDVYSPAVLSVTISDYSLQESRPGWLTLSPMSNTGCFRLTQGNASFFCADDSWMCFAKSLVGSRSMQAKDYAILRF